MVSVDGVMGGREASSVINRLGGKLAYKWSKPYSTTLNWIRARTAFAIIRANNRCIRGCRSKWGSGLGIDDGAE